MLGFVPQPNLLANVGFRSSTQPTRLITEMTTSKSQKKIVPPYGGDKREKNKRG